MSRVSRDSRVSRERACLVRPSVSAKLVMLCVRKEMLKLNAFSLGRGAWPAWPRPDLRPAYRRTADWNCQRPQVLPPGALLTHLT